MIPQDEIFNGNEELSAGKVLLSEPFMWDPNFKRTVILLAEYEKEGTLGFILNRPMDIKLSDVIRNSGDMGLPLHLGGPVEPESLHFIHTLGSRIADSKEILPNLYWGGNFEQMMAMVSDGIVDDKSVRFFLGYSGWGAEQLEDEVAQNSWFVTSVNSSMIMKQDIDNLWKNVLQEKGGDYKIISNYPEDPNLN